MKRSFLCAKIVLVIVATVLITAVIGVTLLLCDIDGSGYSRTADREATAIADGKQLVNWLNDDESMSAYLSDDITIDEFYDYCDCNASAQYSLTAGKELDGNGRTISIHKDFDEWYGETSWVNVDGNSLGLLFAKVCEGAKLSNLTVVFSGNFTFRNAPLTKSGMDGGIVCGYNGGILENVNVIMEENSIFAIADIDDKEVNKYWDIAVGGIAGRNGGSLINTAMTMEHSVKLWGYAKAGARYSIIGNKDYGIESCYVGGICGYNEGKVYGVTLNIDGTSYITSRHDFENAGSGMTGQGGCFAGGAVGYNDAELQGVYLKKAFTFGIDTLTLPENDEYPVTYEMYNIMASNQISKENDCGAGWIIGGGSSDSIQRGFYNEVGIDLIVTDDTGNTVSLNSTVLDSSWYDIGFLFAEDKAQLCLNPTGDVAGKIIWSLDGGSSVYRSQNYYEGTEYISAQEGLLLDVLDGNDSRGDKPLSVSLGYALIAKPQIVYDDGSSSDDINAVLTYNGRSDNTAKIVYESYVGDNPAGIKDETEYVTFGDVGVYDIPLLEGIDLQDRVKYDNSRLSTAPSVEVVPYSLVLSDDNFAVTGGDKIYDGTDKFNGSVTVSCIGAGSETVAVETLSIKYDSINAGDTTLTVRVRIEDTNYTIDREMYTVNREGILIMPRPLEVALSTNTAGLYDSVQVSFSGMLSGHIVSIPIGDGYIFSGEQFSFERAGEYSVPVAVSDGISDVTDNYVIHCKDIDGSVSDKVHIIVKPHDIIAGDGIVFVAEGKESDRLTVTDKRTEYQILARLGGQIGRKIKGISGLSDESEVWSICDGEGDPLEEMRYTLCFDKETDRIEILTEEYRNIISLEVAYSRYGNVISDVKHYDIDITFAEDTLSFILDYLDECNRELSAPDMLYNEFVCWVIDEEMSELSADIDMLQIVYRGRYNTTKTISMTIGSQSVSLPFNTGFTVTTDPERANDRDTYYVSCGSEVFGGWTVDDKLISLRETERFTAIADYNIQAVAKESADVPDGNTDGNATLHHYIYRDNLYFAVTFGAPRDKIKRISVLVSMDNGVIYRITPTGMTDEFDQFLVIAQVGDDYRQAISAVVYVEYTDDSCGTVGETLKLNLR